MAETIEKLADGIFVAVKEYVGKAFDALAKQVAEIEQRVANLPVPKNGIDGKDGAPGERGEKGEAGPQGLPGAPGEKGVDGKDGIDGKDADIEEIVRRVLEAIPKPKDGKDGIDGRDGVNGKDGAPGKDADAEAIVARVLEAIPKPKDGINGKDGAPGVDGRDGRDGTPGPQGRDALDIDILEKIEDGRSYPAGTYARHRGGLLKSVRNTDPIEAGLERSGWIVIVDGMELPSVETTEDLRTIRLTFAQTSGKSVTHEFRLPVVIHRGVFKMGRNYAVGDCVTWDGSSWIALEDTSDTPGTSKAWRLSVKRGSDKK